MSGSERITVLLVEDNVDDYLLVRRAFEKLGLGQPLWRVEDGEAAIRYLEGKGEYADRSIYPLPVLVLLDLKLPGLSGFDVLKWIRSQQVIRRIPVVVLTSSCDLRDINRAYELGANSYLKKPVSPADVEGMIAALGLYWLRWNQYPEVVCT
jgi:CheY-like chemotaxis protein